MTRRPIAASAACRRVDQRQGQIQSSGPAGRRPPSTVRAPRLERHEKKVQGLIAAALLRKPVIGVIDSPIMGEPSDVELD